MENDSFNLLTSKSIFPFGDNYMKEHQQFAEKLLKAIKRSEKCSQKNLSNLKKEMSHEKVLNWFFKLNQQDKKKICTLSNIYLREMFLQLFQLYEKNNKITFRPAKKMLIFFFQEEDKIRNEEEQNSYNSLNFSSNNGFLSNDKTYYSNKKVYSDIDDFENEETQKYKFFDNKYFIINKMQSDEDENTAKIDNQIEIEFLKNINFVSSDRSTITFSDELLLDFEKFNKFFKYISINNCFGDCLMPKNKDQPKHFTLPVWMSKNKENLTFCQIIAGFFEQKIILNYEYNYFANRIYQSSNGNKIVELYDEINNIVEQISNKSYYFNNIFSKNIITQQINKVKEMNELSITIYDELKNYIDVINNEKERIIKLLKKITFVNFNDAICGKVLIYESYKKFILDYYQNKIANELLDEDNKPKKSKNKKHKNKKGKNKMIRETYENGVIKKEEKKEEEKKEEKEEEEENAKKEIKEEKDERNIIENNISEAKDDIIISEKKNKKNKEFFLFQTKTKQKKVKTKKSKINKIDEINSKFSKNCNGNEKNSENELIRIMSKTSLSTYKSSNYQEDQLSKNEEEDSSSLISDITPKNNKNNNNISIPSPNNANNENIKNSKNDNKSNNSNINFYNNNTINNGDNNESNKNIKINYKNGTNKKKYKKYNNYANSFNNYNYNSNNINNNNYTNHFIFNDYYYNYIDEGILNYCSITENNLQILTPLKEKYFEIIKNKIQNHFKDKYKLDFGVYGSFVTDLSIEGSDIDCCIIHKKLLENDSNFKEELFDFLENEKNKNEFSYELKKILNCSHPRIIVKIDVAEYTKNINNSYKYLDEDDIKTIKIDFTFNENIQYLLDNMENVKYIKNQLFLFPQIKPVIKVLKRFLKINKMNELFFGGICSFELFLLVLNSFKTIQQKFPNMQIRICQLLINTFEKFSFFNFAIMGIGINNFDYNLQYYNEEEIPIILNPLTGLNTAQNGRCRGKDIRNVFNKGYNSIFIEKTELSYSFNCGFFPFNKNPFDSVKNLFS